LEELAKVSQEVFVDALEALARRATQAVLDILEKLYGVLIKADLALADILVIF